MFQVVLQTGTGLGAENKYLLTSVKALVADAADMGRIRGRARCCRAAMPSSTLRHGGCVGSFC